MSESEPTPQHEEFRAAAQPFICPECRAVVEVILGDEPAGVACPVCGKEFMVPAQPESEHAEERIDTRKEDEFNALRIRQVTLERRAIVRARAYFVMLGVACVTAAMQLIWYALRGMRSGGWRWEFLGYVALAGLAVWAGAWCYGKIEKYSKELEKKLLDEPATPPDFSALSDGSQHARNLEKLK